MLRRQQIPLTEIQPKRLAIIKPSALGDIVHAMPFANALRQRFPNSNITWVVNKSYVPLLQGHPAIDSLILFDRSGMKKGWKNSAVGILQFAKELRKPRFDAVVDLQCLARTGLMCLASGARRRIGLSTAREGARYAYTDIVDIPEGKNIHAVDSYLKVANAFGLQVTAPEFAVPVQADALSWAQAQLSGLPRPWLAFGVGARWLTKRWLPEHFAELANRAQQRFGGTVFFVGTPDEAPLATQVFDQLNGAKLNFCGSTSLTQLIALLSLCDVMVANDTGPLHVAVGLGKPTVAPYTCTVTKRHGPYLQLGGVETNVPCKGSYIRTCDRLDCMKELTPDRLWPTLAQILSTWQSLSRIR